MRLIRLLDDGFEVEDVGSESVRIRWSEVEEIRTCKFDAFCFDVVELEFVRTSFRNPVRICDEDSGFWDLARRLRDIFPSIPEDWIHGVIFPVFAANERVLIRRS